MSQQKVMTTDESMSVELGRRVAEVLFEKGITPHAFIQKYGQKIGMNKDTFYHCLDGKRYIKPTELEAIAEALQMTVERIKQDDTRERAVELRSLVKKGINSKRAIQLALGLLPAAVGLTEKFHVLNDLGSAYYYTKEIDLAHETWLRALPYAEKINDQFEDKEQLYMITSNLITSYNEQRDYLELGILLSKLDEEFEKTKPIRAGKIKYSQAMVAYNMGNLKKCREKMYEHLHFFEQADDEIDVGIGYQNVASIEFALGNYEKSKEYLERAMKNFSSCFELKYICLKDYVKALIKTKMMDKANDLIIEALKELEGRDLPNLKAKFLLLQSVAKQNFLIAESVLSIEKAGENLKALACQYLMKHYSAQGDSESLMKYYKLAERINENFAPIQWEGM